MLSAFWVGHMIRPYCGSCTNMPYREDFRIAFLPEDISPGLPANLILISLIAFEIFALARGWQRVDHWAHLGGYMTGLSGAYIIKHKQQQHKDTEVER